MRRHRLRSRPEANKTNTQCTRKKKKSDERNHGARTSFLFLEEVEAVVAMGNRFPERSLLVVAAVVLAAAGIPQS